MEHQQRADWRLRQFGGRLKPDTVLSILKREVIEPLKHRFPGIGDQPSFVDGTVHSFRHYFVSRCAASGKVSELVVKDWVGHQESAMLRRYFHLDRDSAARCMNAIDFITDVNKDDIDNTDDNDSEAA